MAVEAQDRITGPATRYVKDARTAALALPRARTAQDTAEVDWERQNPTGVADTSPDRIILWNFAVNSATLNSEHQAALSAAFQVAILDPSLMVGIVGHASVSGPETGNVALSEARATSVQRYLQRIGVPDGAIATVEGRGSAEPIATGTDGQSMARNRRVEVALGYAKPAAPPTQLSITPFAQSTPLAPDARFPTMQGGGQVVFAFKFPLGVIETQWVTLKGEFQARGKITYKGTPSPDVTTALTITGSDASGNPVFAPGINIIPQLGNAAKLRLAAQFSQSGGAIQPEIQVGVEKTAGLLPPGGFRIQSDPRFPVSFYIDTPDWSPADSLTLPNGKSVALQYQGRFVLSAGLGPATIRMLANQIMRYFTGIGAEEAGAALTESILAGIGTAVAALVGSVVLAGVIVLGTMYLIQDQTQAGLERCRLWARRNGYASGVAALVLGQDDTAAKAYVNAYPIDADVRTQAQNGYDAALAEIQYNAPALKALTDRFGKLSFNDCREAVFQALGGMDGDQEPSLNAMTFG
jgi:outer membrane protein OmpA-like peptidoglycan-associated protein